MSPAGAEGGPLSAAEARGTGRRAASAGPAPETGRLRVRAALVLLALGQGVPGAWALCAPRSFHDAFPLPAFAWVTKFPPYNEHLLRDLGALSLGLTTVLLWAAVRPERSLVRAAAFGCLTFTIPHLIFHVAHLGRFETVDVVGQLISQVTPIIVAGMVVLLSRRSDGAGI
ncbi:hypothetical protein SCNRRL3882_7338 [Streptomyces chartreusis NRRL 3882]|uniref:Integral membrane protein n=1 Tax=Streptomyces chartreusis NRRL 3882 TaxID=1079985 RepID=A0A2N9BKK8_STRCX|nr:hypothetical protein SCNRRL3882_7338 [Streptomyces chartreusis NRRL 3882]